MLKGTELLELCRALGRWLHRDQVDKAGAPYAGHLERVAARVADNPMAECLAWLHDAVEDGHVSTEALAALGLPTRLRSALRAITHWQPLYYSDYIARVAADPLATRCKLADLEDNLDSSRGPIPESLRARYLKAQRILREAQEAWPE